MSCESIFKLTEKCGFVRVTFDKEKKRPWRVELWKCRRCRMKFVGAKLEDVMAVALIGNNE